MTGFNDCVAPSGGTYGAEETSSDMSPSSSPSATRGEQYRVPIISKAENTEASASFASRVSAHQTDCQAKFLLQLDEITNFQLSNDTQWHEQLAHLEAMSIRLDPDENQRSNLMSDAIKSVDNILRDIHDRRAFQSIEYCADQQFDVGEQGESMKETMKFLDAFVFNRGLSSSNGGDMSYIPSGGIYAAALGDLLACVSNLYPSQYCAPGALQLEHALIRWLVELVGFPSKTAGGDLTSGGSVATLCAVVAARDALSARVNDFVVNNTVVYLTKQTHFCLRKALHIAGLGKCIVRFVDIDEQFRMCPDALVSLIQEDCARGFYPWLLVACAGSTCVGAVDPINTLADIAQRFNIWFHVDAAYGGCFNMTEYGRNLMKGIGRADTIVIDPHKGLFLPMGSGAILARDVSLLANSFRYTASYMQDDIDAIGDELLSPCDLGPELSRPFRGLRMWLPLRVFGVEPFRNALEEKLTLAQYLYASLKAIPDFQVGLPPQLSIVHFRYSPASSTPNGLNERTFDDKACDEANKKLVEAVRDDGTCFISSTCIKGRYMLRCAVLNFRTHRKHIDALINVLRREIHRVKIR